ncbi:MAG: hypothetical protein D6729_16690, partial [Deltaproteobacteria bacterium]
MEPRARRPSLAPAVLGLLAMLWGCECGGAATDELQVELDATSPVVADGVRTSVVTCTVRRNGTPAAGLEVTFVSDRGDLDTIEQPTGPTDAAGQASGRVSSTTPGEAKIGVRIAGR